MAKRGVMLNRRQFMAATAVQAAFSAIAGQLAVPGMAHALGSEGFGYEVTDQAPISATGVLGTLISKTRYEDLPDEVIEKTKELLIHAFARALEGCSDTIDPKGSHIKTLAQRSHMAKGVSVIGLPYKLLPSDAAFANCSLMRGSTRDDVIWPGGVHAGVVTIPSALAAAEMLHRSGKDLILSIVLGYEVLGRLSRRAAGWTAPYPRRSTIIYGPYGAVTCVGKLLNMSPGYMANALGYAANIGIGVPDMMEHFYSFINRNGFLATQLAQNGGFTYGPFTIEGELGLYRSFFDCLPADLFSALRGDENSWTILSSDPKRYYGTGANSVAIDLLTGLIEAQSIHPDHIVRIDATLRKTNMASERTDAVITQGPFGEFYDPYTSMPFALGLVLLGKKVEPIYFTKEKQNDPAVLTQAKKIFVRYGEETDHERFCRLNVALADGTSFTVEGHSPNTRIPRTEWWEWLDQYGATVLPRHKLKKIEELIGNLEHVDDVATLMATASSL